ncbi:MAG: hypothetical protein Q8K98_07435 [Bacteroidota bacterium]|nr:hypothetical protein [Bacteroidota bacterium]
MNLHKYVVILTIVLISVSASLSLPRFSARTGISCQGCHINPSGGGMRNYYGTVFYGRQTLPVKKWFDSFEISNFTSKINEFVSIGADFRTLFYYVEKTRSSSFYQMQGDIYANLKIAEGVSMYIDKGLYKGFEIFGLMNILPENGYIKVGRFTPVFGTKTDDHTNFIRAKTVFQNNRAEDSGIEAATAPGNFAVTVGLFNGASSGDLSDSKIRLLTGNADARFKIEEINFSIGSSLWFNSLSSGIMRMFGGYGSINYINITVNGEIDLKQDKSILGLGTKELISLVELNYLLFDGLDLKFMYDYYDYDIRYKTGFESRYSFGFEFFPISGVEVRPVYRLSQDRNKNKNNEINFLIHFYL